MNTDAPPSRSGADRFCVFRNGHRICYRVQGNSENTPLLLIAGLGQQLTSWPIAVVEELVNRGYFVIRFDNRDVGQSSQIPSRPPGRMQQLFRRPPPDAYDLGDMAGDAVALLDHLEIDRAHLVGMSMGGMIAQTIAARYPERTRTLTSIFSTTGHPRVGQPANSTLLRLVRPPAKTRDQAIERHLGMMRHISTKALPLDEQRERTYAAEAWERGAGPKAHLGVARQIGAILKSGDRTRELGKVTAPTLVIHGDTDRMVHPSGGKATVAAIPGARHETIVGMGHYLPEAALPRLVDLITGHARASNQ